MNKKLKKKIDEKIAQPLIAIPPSAEQCRKCIYSLPDTQYTTGAEKAFCDIFTPPEGKSAGILTDDVECPYFVEK
jgi:hypothetical protein